MSSLADEVTPPSRSATTLLIAAYDRAETAYVSRGRPEKQSFEGDYDHLARRGEWEGEDGE